MEIKEAQIALKDVFGLDRKSRREFYQFIRSISKYNTHDVTIQKSLSFLHGRLPIALSDTSHQKLIECILIIAGKTRKKAFFVPHSSGECIMDRADKGWSNRIPGSFRSHN